MIYVSRSPHFDGNAYQYLSLWVDLFAVLLYGFPSGRWEQEPKSTSVL